MTSRPWPATLPVRHVRIARPTDQLGEVVRFYREGLGLPELDRLAGHVGYRGVLLGWRRRIPTGPNTGRSPLRASITGGSC